MTSEPDADHGSERDKSGDKRAARPGAGDTAREQIRRDGG